MNNPLNKERCYWLMKSEPSCFSILDLAEKPRQSETWDGIRNYQARNFLKTMQKGDLAFFYHSSCSVPGIVGIMQIVKTAFPDKTAFQQVDHCYSNRSNKCWLAVEVQLVEKFEAIIPLAVLKKQPSLKNMRLLKKGCRLSVMPLTLIEWKNVLILKK